MATTKETAATYTHGHHASVLRSHSWRTAKNSCAYLLPHIKPAMRILDVGCGPGTITVDLATYVPDGSVIGIEPESAAGVLETARAHALEKSVKNVEFSTGSVFALPFDDATFDIVHVHQVLQHICDPIAALREMRRVTKEGGIMAAREADFGGWAWYPSIPGLDQWQQLYQKVARKNGGEPDAGRRIHVWAREAGFKKADMTLSVGTWCYASDKERAWWSDLWAERTLKSNFADTALKNGVCSEKDLASASQAWRDWGSDEDGWMSCTNGEMVAVVHH